MTNRFTERAQRALNASLSAAADLGHTYIGSEHILLGLMADDASIAAKMLRAHGADRTRVREAVVNMAGEGVPSQVSPADMTPRTQKIIQESATLSVHAGQSYIGTEHLLLALLGEGDCVAVRLLDDLNIPVDELKRDVQNFLGASPGAENIGQSRSAGNESQAEQSGGRSRSGKEIRRTEKALAGTPTLAQYGRDLTAMLAMVFPMI